jgi:hypothetical protein
MSEPTRIPRSSETIQTPRPSWGPAFFALGATGAVAGIYANGFVFSAFIWSYIGIVILLFAFRAILRGSIRSYYSLPRRQEAQPATLPVEQIYLDSRSTSGRPQG